MNLKIAFDSLSKKLLFTLFTIIQMTVTFTFLYNLIYINSESKSLEEKFNKSFKENMYVIEPKIDLDDILSDDNLKGKELYKFHDYLKSDENLKSISNLDSYILTSEFKDYEKFLYTDNYAPNFDGVQTRAINAVEVDYGYIKNFGITVKEGENLTKEDFNIKDNKVPILLGENFKGIFNIGEVIEGYDYYGKKIDYIVKGFIDKGFYNIGVPLNEYNIRSLDNSILVPFKENKFNKSSEDFDIVNQVHKSIVTIDDDKNRDELLENANMNFGNIKITKLDTLLEKYKEGIKIERTIVLNIFLVVMIICAVGITTNIMNSIKLRTKDFGVYMLNGASKKDIIKIVVYEILIIFTLSALLSSIGISILGSLQYVTINKIYILKLLLYILIITLIILIYPIKILKKISINSLLRGE
ncbi:MAG: ABC transporter permease [Clostridium chrysemydis]|uniref:ABC transporter permease n=1 Tax=Clostridium chrysemydis TaxID=2665504 RepID=UPI003F2D0507